MGSAERFPAIQGGFRQSLICAESQAVPTGLDTPFDRSAFASTLAQALHAVRLGGKIAGQRVYISGCGPLGLLSLLAARHAGAREIIAADTSSKPLLLAQRLGAESIMNVSSETDALKSLRKDGGMVDLAFETSGVASEATVAMTCLRPGGRLVQLAHGTEMMPTPDLLISKELEYCGAFRFHEEFEWAVDLLIKRAIDVAPLLGAAMPFRNARAAFDLASDRVEATKVQLVFE